MAHGTAESTVPIAFQRPSDTEGKDIAVYTPGYKDIAFTGGPGTTPDPVLVACGATSISGYGIVLGADGKCWLDRNLGASRVATSYNDSSAYGDLYQWGRGNDGHQSRTSSVVAGPVGTNTPGSSFITVADSSPWDWRNPQQTLWSGINGTNNPCPTGFRLPTRPEWSTLLTSSGITNYVTAYNSSLKLTESGHRNYNNASLHDLGTLGYYWSSSYSGVNAYYMAFGSLAYPSFNGYRSYGFSVRCIKN